MNPIDISLFIDRHKIVRKATTSASNNLDRLYQRQAQLSSQQLDTDKLLKLNDTKKKYEDQEKLLLIWITKVNGLLEGLDTVSDDSEIIDIDDLRTTLRDNYNDILSYTHIDRASSETKLTTLPVHIQLLDNEILECTKSLATVVTNINDYEAKLKSISKSNTSSEEELADLVVHANTYEFKTDFIPLSIDDIDNARETNNKLNYWLTNLSYVTYDKILSKHEYQLLKESLREHSNLLSSAKIEASTNSKRKRDANKLINEYDTASICDKGSCELYIKYNSHVTAKKNELAKLVKIGISLSKRIDKLESTCMNLAKELEIQTLVWKHLDEIYNSLSGPISRYIDMSDLPNIVQNYPNGISTIINNYIRESESYISYQSLLKRIDILEKDKATVNNNIKFSSKVLTSELDKYKIQLDELRNVHITKTLERDNHVNDLRLLTKFHSSKCELIELSNNIVIMEKDTSVSASIDYLNRVNTILDKMLNDIRKELIDITDICKEQESIAIRLDKEVNTVIDEYKTLHTNSKLVEESLSELPINYTKEFVNSIITTTNYFIGEMTSYHMVIDPVDTLNFVFPLSIEGIKIRDISECSQGQIGIITLAFNLAMIIELDLNNYPVYVDEIDRNLDTVHKNLLADLINKLVTNKIVSQLFLIAHDQVLIDGFSGDTILLTKDSIEVPAGYNDNVKITYG
jgi:hypothetical protein